MNFKMCSKVPTSSRKKTILVIEPFYGGSHKKLIDFFTSGLPVGSYHLITMSPRQWHWRARSSALYIASKIPKNMECYEILFSSSVLALHELLGLKPELSKLRKIIYFHENQLVYPMRCAENTDFQYGYNEILSCLSADVVLFNSNYNQESFLNNVDGHLNIQPDYIINNVQAMIRPKCKVVYYPIDLPRIAVKVNEQKLKLKTRFESKTLHIVWPHRWEYDKDPQAFVNVLYKLKKKNIKFKVSILGQFFNGKNNSNMNDLKRMLKNHLVHFGYVEDDVYFSILDAADVVVSTAIHEFFGVAVMEAVYFNCIPVVPRRLAYLELYAPDVKEMYSSPSELFNTLKNLSLLKQKGQLNKSYRYLTMPYDSTIWMNNIIEIMYPFLLENPFPCQL